MSSKVSTFNSVKMNNYRYLFIIVGWTDYVTPVTEELQKQFEPFGASLGSAGVVVQAYKSSAIGTFEEVKNKDWDPELLRRFESEQQPFMLVLEKDFDRFDPTRDPFGIIWFSDYEKEPSTVTSTLHQLALKTKEGHDLFDYLHSLQRKRTVSRVGKYFEVKPKILWLSVDAKAIVSDITKVIRRRRT